MISWADHVMCKMAILCYLRVRGVQIPTTENGHGFQASFHVSQGYITVYDFCLQGLEMYSSVYIMYYT